MCASDCLFPFASAPVSCLALSYSDSRLTFCFLFDSTAIFSSMPICLPHEMCHKGECWQVRRPRHPALCFHRNRSVVVHVSFGFPSVLHIPSHQARLLMIPCCPLCCATGPSCFMLPRLLPIYESPCQGNPKSCYRVSADCAFVCMCLCLSVSVCVCVYVCAYMSVYVCVPLERYCSH